MRIAILDDYHALALSCADWSVLPDDVEVVPFSDHTFGEDPLVARLADFDIVCRMRQRTHLPGRVLKRLPRLKLIAATGGRNPDIGLEVAREMGITVCQTDSHGQTTTEIAWWLILSLMRKAQREHVLLRSGGWQAHLGQDVCQKTLGVIGFGRLGSAVARVGVAFGMKVVAWSPTLTDSRATEAGAHRVAFEDLLAEADVVTIHVPLDDRSCRMIGAAELDRMKPGAVLVNTSRGPIVDEAALLEALRCGRLGGLGVDVFDNEPLPVNHPFRTMENVVATPHIGYVTEEAYRLYYRQTVENVCAFLAGSPIRVLA